MRGVQFMVDATGRKTGVVIDPRKNPELWEDLFDRALVRKRKGVSIASSQTRRPKEP